MENGKWKMENGKWKTENGKRKMENDEPRKGCQIYCKLSIMDFIEP